MCICMLVGRGMGWGWGVGTTYKLHYITSAISSVCLHISLFVCLPINLPDCLSLGLIDQQLGGRGRGLVSAQQEYAMLDVQS